MTNQMKFERYECKYMLNKYQYDKLMDSIGHYLNNDKYGQTTICNLYFDTPLFTMIRNSIMKPSYKEKLRMRSYGQVSSQDTVFIEIKKKFDSIVYKRRICKDYKKAIECSNQGFFDGNTQIDNEINYLFKFYPKLTPSIYLAYNRLAYYAKNNQDLRLTFDTNIIWRNYDLDLTKGIYGQKLLKDGEILLEIKTPDAIPLWLSKILCELKIYKTSFSKYGEIYQRNFINKEKL